jgi:hypothetical protein
VIKYPKQSGCELAKRSYEFSKLSKSLKPKFSKRVFIYHVHAFPDFCMSYTAAIAMKLLHINVKMAPGCSKTIKKSISLMVLMQ